MNEHLKFSWGHIIAFLALIIIGYISFVGVTYYTDGNFIKAGIATCFIIILLIIFFMGAQMMKATDHKFSKRIKIERFFIFGSPIVFIVMMLPLYHFGSVQSKDDEIVKDFTEAIKASKQLFKDYDNYSSDRIFHYEQLLDSVISLREVNPQLFKECGYVKGKEDIQKNNMLKALRLQLISHNYDSLKIEAIKWIDKSSDGASTWNVFLLGNTKEIKNAIHEWNYLLIDYTKHKMTNEELNNINKVKDFDKVSSSLSLVDKGLDGLTSKFTQKAFPPLISIIGSFILYFALLFPYILQDRHTKSQMRLIGIEEGASYKPSTEILSDETSNINVTTNKNSSSSDGDDYSSFTLS